MMKNYAMTQESLSGSKDVDLVSSAQKGDLESFNQLVLIYQDEIYSLARRTLGDEELAADITQNTFLSAYRGLPRFRNGSFRGWLYRITINACYTEFRRQKRHPVLSLESDDDIDADERLLPGYDLSSPTMLPEKELERRELERAIQGALNQLNEYMRSVIVLVDIQDFDYQEAAQILGVPVGTVKSRLARGRMRLQQLLRAVDGFGWQSRKGSVLR